MLLTIGELARTIGVAVGTLRRWDKAGKLSPHLRTVGGHRRYLLDEVLEFLGAYGGTIEVLDEDVRRQEEMELAKDVLTIITVFSSRLYGRRAHTHRQQRLAA